ncbi:MAG: hypothetical protein IKH09_08945 [Clostridia bacterium]|nr:hypothetical protein [Clostridia bacterium]
MDTSKEILEKALEFEKRKNPGFINYLLNKSNSSDEIKSFGLYVIKKTESIKLATIDSEFQNDIIKKVFKDRELFQNNLRNKWGHCFDLSTILRVSVSSLTDKHIKYVEKCYSKNELPEKENTWICLKYLLGRAIQVYAEIMCLVENGFPDAALARWRTLYELTCSAEFINNNGEQVAKAFKEYDNRNSNYEWANKAKCFAGQDFVSFHSIEKQCDFSKSGWNKVKKLAHLPIHVGANGTFSRAGLEKNKPIPIGPVESGIAFPATQAAYMLGIISTIFFSSFVNIDSAINSYLIYDLVEMTVNKYYQVFETQTSDISK